MLNKKQLNSTVFQPREGVGRVFLKEVKEEGDKQV